MMKRNAKGFRTKLGFERLEGRRLLAADFACSMMTEVDVAQPEQVEVVSAEYGIEAEIDQSLVDALGESETNSPVDSMAATNSEAPQDALIEDQANESVFDTQDDQAELSNLETVLTDEVSLDASVEAEFNIDPRNLDLSDGMDGFFGSISAESPSESLNFTASSDGIATVAVSSSY